MPLLLFSFKSISSFSINHNIISGHHSYTANNDLVKIRIFLGKRSYNLACFNNDILCLGLQRPTYKGLQFQAILLLILLGYSATI